MREWLFVLTIAIGIVLIVAGVTFSWGLGAGLIASGLGVIVLAILVLSEVPKS